MYAIIEDSGQQFKVKENDEIRVDLRDVKTGDKIVFENVIAISDKGSVKTDKDSLKKSKVIGSVEAVEKGDKVIVGVFKRRKNFRKRNGHRQKYLRVKIKEIST
jgi:large subunit ribosomal protein L21